MSYAAAELASVLRDEGVDPRADGAHTRQVEQWHQRPGERQRTSESTERIEPGIRAALLVDDVHLGIEVDVAQHREAPQHLRAIVRVVKAQDALKIEEANHRQAADAEAAEPVVDDVDRHVPILAPTETGSEDGSTVSPPRRTATMPTAPSPVATTTRLRSIASTVPGAPSPSARSTRSMTIVSPRTVVVAPGHGGTRARTRLRIRVAEADQSITPSAGVRSGQYIPTSGSCAVAGTVPVAIDCQWSFRRRSPATSRPAATDAASSSSEIGTAAAAITGPVSIVSST